jgi:hypothetical protein
LGVFWTTIAAEAEVFFVIFVATAIILWVNGLVASRLARSPWTQRPADFEWKPTDLIVVRSIRRKNLSQVRLAEDQDPVQALATHGANAMILPDDATPKSDGIFGKDSHRRCLPAPTR